MNDPHVAALVYKIEHGPSVDYRKAESIDHEEAEFRVKIANEEVRFEFKEHYATEDAARKAIEDYIRAWEFGAGLENGPSCFKLKFDHAQIEDRNPTPGGLELHAQPLRFDMMLSKAILTVSRNCYPPPPSGVKITPDVQLMYDRYMDHLQGREKLLDVAYFCWTMVKDNPVTTTDFSRGVCTRYDQQTFWRRRRPRACEKEGRNRQRPSDRSRAPLFRRGDQGDYPPSGGEGSRP